MRIEIGNEWQLVGVDGRSNSAMSICIGMSVVGYVGFGAESSSWDLG